MKTIEPKEILFYNYWLSIILLEILDGFINGFNDDFILSFPTIITCSYAIFAKLTFTFLKMSGKHLTRYEDRVIYFGAIIVLIVTSLSFSIFRYEQLYNLFFLIALIGYIISNRWWKLKRLYKRFIKKS